MNQITQKITTILQISAKSLAHILKRKTAILVLAVVIAELVFPQISLAHVLAPGKNSNSVMLGVRYVAAAGTEPTTAAVKAEPKQVLYVPMTAYTSEVAQTDASPCITADGYNVCTANEENVIAANFLPFGTQVRIPEYFGDRVFTVHDRMNRRYTKRVDVWMKNKSDAMQFGVRTLKIEVL